MAILGDIRFLERIQFFNGQRLLANDLQSLESFEREMRWLHNLSLHQPGIGSGFAVTGKKGDQEITIGAGYAIDAFGREMILTLPDTEQIPPVADNGAGQPALYDLLVSYPPDANLTPSETRDGVCAQRGTVRVHEEPVFCWARMSDDSKQPADTRLKDLVQQQLMIVLAQVAIQNCQLKDDVNVAIRRNARPPKQPRIACGTVSVTSKDLHSASLAIDAGSGSAATSTPVTSRRVTVKTSSGGFSSTPSYFARIRGADDRVISELLFGAVLHVTAEAPTSFELHFLKSAQFVPMALERASARATVKLFDIVWMGVEA
jgi:hypothetical protein